MNFFFFFFFFYFFLSKSLQHSEILLQSKGTVLYVYRGDIEKLF